MQNTRFYDLDLAALKTCTRVERFCCRRAGRKDTTGHFETRSRRDSSIFPAVPVVQNFFIPEGIETVVSATPRCPTSSEESDEAYLFTLLMFVNGIAA